MFAVIDAQGHYGSHATVHSAHESASEAARAASAWNLRSGKSGPKVTAVECDACVGDRVHSSDAARYEQRARRYFADLRDEQRRLIDLALRENASSRRLAKMRTYLELFEFWA